MTLWTIINVVLIMGGVVLITHAKMLDNEQSEAFTAIIPFALGSIIGGVGILSLIIQGITRWT